MTDTFNVSLTSGVQTKKVKPADTQEIERQISQTQSEWTAADSAADEAANSQYNIAQGDAKILKTNMDDARKNLSSLRYIEAKANPAYTLYTGFGSNNSVQDNTVRANSLQNRQDVKIGTKQYVKTQENGQNVYYEINGDKATKIDDKAIVSKINKKLEEM